VYVGADVLNGKVLLWKQMIHSKILWLTIKFFKYKWLRAAIIEKIEKYLKGNK
jgi:hypothetical protein